MPPEVQDPPQNASSPQVIADILQWDVRNWSEALRFWERSVDWPQVHNCLELGGREGGLSLWLALHGKNVVCSDYEDTRERAREHHQKYQLGGNIEYATIDAVSIPYENHFDVIAFKSMLGAVGGGNDKQRQQLAIDQMHKALKPGGYLLFAENMAGSPLHRFIRRRFIKWGQWWRYVTAPEMGGFLSQFNRVELRTTGVLATFGRREWQRNLLGAVDQALVKHITPSSWRYLVYGIAQK